MATIAEFTIPSDAFPLGSVFDEHPGVTVELERVIPTETGLIPYFWVRNVGETEEREIADALGRHPDVERIETVDTVDGEYLKRVTWRSGYSGILRAIAEADVTLLSGVGNAEEWTFELRATQRDAIGTFQQYCADHDLPVELRALHTLTQSKHETAYDLTDSQREALLLAYERGYYRTPREATLEEMADELGITGQSMGARLRRGIHRLLGDTVAASESTGD